MNPSSERDDCKATTADPGALRIDVISDAAPEQWKREKSVRVTHLATGIVATARGVSTTRATAAAVAQLLGHVDAELARLRAAGASEESLGSWLALRAELTVEVPGWCGKDERHAPHPAGTPTCNGFGLLAGPGL